MNPMEYVSPEPYKLYINGQYVAAEKGNIVDVINPANNQPFAKVYRGTKEDCEKAIQAARKAFDEGPWSKMSAKERSKLLLKAARILERRAEEFSVIEPWNAARITAPAVTGKRPWRWMPLSFLQAKPGIWTGR